MNDLGLFLRLSFVMIFVVYISLIQAAPQLGKSSLKKVIAAMTIEEKVNLVMGTGMDLPGLPDTMRGPEVGETSERVPGAAGNTFAIPRLGIPSIVLADGPAGLRILPFRDNDSTTSYYCTAFPIATLLASTWDTGLIERVGAAVGNELKEYGVDILLAPALNTHRNPLGGRNFEYYSEDPLVSGKMAAAMVRGVQSQGVGTSLKHFVANNHEWNRFTINVIAGERALREIYLRDFEIAVIESKPWTIMSSYNKVNGFFSSESKDLLTNILRDDWKFNGLVMTDWFGGTDPVAQMEAGNDLLMPGTVVQQQALLKAIQQNRLNKDVLDRNIENILNVILKTPAFKQYKYSNAPDLKKHAQICRQAAADGIVLLKNAENILPLKSGIKLAVLGNSSYSMYTGGTGSGDVNEAYSVSLLDGLKDAGFQVDAKLVETYPAHIENEKTKQPPLENPFMLPPPIPERELTSGEIKRLVSETDLALVTIGRNSGEFADRDLEDDYYLSAAEKLLLRNVSNAFHAAGKKVIVVLNIGGVIDVASWSDQVDAILLAWQAGQESGNAIADVLSGRVNPSGKLATTFPLDYNDVLSSSNFPGTVLQGPDPENKSFLIGDRAAKVIYKDDIWVGYRNFISNKIEPAYPFGFGLSYTNFEYGDLQLSADEFKEKLSASITITNTGKTAGREIVQLYLSAPVTNLPKPAAELKGFAKTGLLKPGASETIFFDITIDDLASFDPVASAWVADEGKYTVKIGASSMDIRRTQTFQKMKMEISKKVSRSLVPQVPIAKPDKK